MKKVLQQLRQYRKDTFLCIGLTALEVLMEILLPFITARLIDEGLEKANLPVVYRYGAIMVVTLNIFNRVFQKYDDLNASVQENISAIRVVKAFVREGYERTASSPRPPATCIKCLSRPRACWPTPTVSSAVCPTDMTPCSLEMGPT